MRPVTAPSERTSLPRSWAAAHWMHQSVVLLVLAVAFVLTTWGSPIYQALFAGLPTLLVPPGIPVSPRLLGPLFIPLLLGIPFLLGGQRVIVVASVAVMVLLACLSVVEVSRLNWASFISGVAFRVEGGAVPLVRTLAGLAVVLSGLLLLGQHSVRETLLDLADRGVPLSQLTEVRTQLLVFERIVIVALFGTGIVLTLVAALSMGLTEEGPVGAGGGTAALVWTAILLALIAVAFALGAWRRKGRSGAEDPFSAS